MVCLATFAALCMNGIASASDEKLRTGLIVEISEKRIELELPSVKTSHIGFTCEPVVCESTHQFGAGDHVLLRLGAENRKNKLLSIRLCKKDDPECEKVRNEELEETRHAQERSDKRQEQWAQCDAKMKSDMSSDSRYVADVSKDLSEQERNAITDRYKSLYADPIAKSCLLKIVDGHQRAVIESCL